MARILVVEDEEPVREVLRQALERDGHEVAAARDGREGLEAVAASPPELVVTDLIMPQMGGVVFIERLRGLQPDLPVLAISGGGRVGRFDFLSPARSIPGVWTLKKPFRIAELVRQVREILPGLVAG